MFAHPVAAGGGRRKAQVRRDLLLHDAVHPRGLDILGARLVDEALYRPPGALADQVREVEFTASRPAGEEVEQAEGVFATRQSDEDFIVLVDELELSQRLVKLFPKSFV